MRVVYDGVVFQNSYQRGIQRAFREIIDHMPSGVEMTLALADRPKCALPERATVRRTVPAVVGFMHRRMRRWLIPKLSPSGMRKVAAGADVFHSTYYTLPPRDMPTVLHVHDLIPERFPEMFPEPWAAAEIEQRKKAILQATRIVTISRATADDVIRMYPEVAQRVTTVYFGCDHLQKARPDGEDKSHPMQPSREGERYALFVGERKKYKNFKVIFEAMKIEKWPGDVGLVVAGPPFTEEEQAIADEINPTLPVRHAGRPTDEQLADLFAGSMCVIVPSLAEGFGFPVLEGQAAGTHVVCSDIPVFREVAGAGAFYFDPKKPEDLAAKIADAASPITHRTREEAVWQNLRRFSWDKCSREILSAYEVAVRV
jgi:glycosyltransferase involved in cell wall biosynthesis